MIDFSWGHILLVLMVALVVVGPKDLPRLMRTVGQWVGKARNMANEFRKSFDDMTRQAELDELRAEIEALKNDQALADVEKELNQTAVIGTPIDSAQPMPAPEPVAAPSETPPAETTADVVPASPAARAPVTGGPTPRS